MLPEPGEIMAPSTFGGRSVLVTGGTGSFGNAFVRHVLASGVRRVVVLSRDELKQSEMRTRFPDERVRFMIGSVTNAERVKRAMRGCDYVVHAAAMKQIPACEQHPAECVNTNVLGTQVVALAAIDAGVKRAVFLSTDKAAQPNTHYGACKLAAERLWNGSNVYAAGTPTRLVATRYGNVIGSRGSVVPLFRRQAEKGLLTITDKRMTRFWMRIQQAVDLVELALAQGRGGDVFIPRVPACGILTVAEAVAPGVKTAEIGIRPGEKLHETLVAEDEARQTREYPDHYRIEPHRTWEEESPVHTGDAVPSGWSYRSDTNPDQLDAEGFSRLLEEA